MIESERKHLWSSGYHSSKSTLEALRSLLDIELMRYVVVRLGKLEGVETVLTRMVEKDSLFEADHRRRKTSVYCGTQ